MLALVLSSLVAAAPADDLLDAADTFERALTLVFRQPRACQDALAGNLRQSTRDVRAAAGKRGTTSDTVQSLRLFAAGLVLASGLSTCPSQVTETISDGVGSLNRAFDGLVRLEAADAPPPPRRRVDLEDEEPVLAVRRRANPPPRVEVDDDAPVPVVRRRPVPAGVTLGRLRVTLDTPSTLDGSPALLIEATAAQFDAPAIVFFGAACRSRDGRARTEWSMTEPVSVRAGVLPSPASFSFRESTLERAGLQGRFRCRVGAFEAQSRAELASTEVDVELSDDGPRRAPPPAARDCGAGPGDPGCLLARGTRLPMDAIEFGGVLSTLRGASGDLNREALATRALERSLLTAAQLGLVMDTFTGDLTRLDVVRKLARNVVNPRHALVHASKFSSSLSREEFVDLLSRQD